MTDEELMQEALDALQWSSEYLEGIGAKLFPESRKTQPGSTVWHVRKSIANLKKRLEQPAQQQEPVAFLANGTRFKMSFFENEDGPGTNVTCFEAFEKELDGRWVALVAAEDDCHLKLTSPPASKPLTDEEIIEVIHPLVMADMADEATDYEISRAIEAKLKEKNA